MPPLSVAPARSWSCVANGDITPGEEEAQSCNNQASLESVHNYFHGAVSAGGRGPAVLSVPGSWAATEWSAGGIVGSWTDDVGWMHAHVLCTALQSLACCYCSLTHADWWLDGERATCQVRCCHHAHFSMRAYGRRLHWCPQAGSVKRAHQI